jgi:hypothetical protein
LEWNPASKCEPSNILVACKLEAVAEFDLAITVAKRSLSRLWETRFGGFPLDRLCDQAFDVDQADGGHAPKYGLRRRHAGPCDGRDASRVLGVGLL